MNEAQLIKEDRVGEVKGREQKDVGLRKHRIFLGRWDETRDFEPIVFI